ncbi:MULTISPECIES: protein-export chaperone SecB [Euryhalocaulis]|uniref:protein-export chaperone SecB n=1 Tax=Euryhalocaulis TaxID=1712422 RepID=UPI0003B66269|nr:MULTISPECIES: protein-export chaperone SecB [Euryhalocaulis]MBA4801513.1 protein-export chaperone SecB [Euryhalocaulis sp.]
MSQTDQQPEAAQDEPQVQILAQYIKDASFENPLAPRSLRSGQNQPQISLNVDVGVRNIEEDLNEVALRIEGKAEREGEVAFICELVYAGLFRFVGVPQDQLQPFLLIEAPRMLFPFARNIVAQLVRDGGFPPLMLEPIDFAALYRQRLAQQGAAENGDGTGGAEQANGEES